MSDREAIEEAIRSYCEAWERRDRPQWLAAFREDATQEDPIGGGIRRGHTEIGRFLDEVWRIDTAREDERIEFEGVDIFTFDRSHRIMTVRAYWEDERRRRSRP